MLSDAKLRSLKASDKIYTAGDSDGLYIEIRPTGRKYWRYRIQIGGKTHKITLGEYPAVGLSEARSKRDSVRNDLLSGKDPNAATPTFGEIALEYVGIKESRSRASERTRYLDRGRLTLHVLPKIGMFIPTDITSTEIKALAKGIELDGHTETARRVLNLIKNVYDYAINENYTQDDPTVRLRKVIHPKPKKHMASVTDPEGIGMLMRLISNYSQEVVRFALQLQAYTFVRPSELRLAKWHEFDIKDRLWRIPAEKMKAKSRPHLVPLSRQSIEILERLRGITGHLAHPFVCKEHRGVPMCENTQVKALLSLKDDEGNKVFRRGEITAHGFRSMASTRLHEEGWMSAAVELQLAHRVGSEVAVAYNYAEHMPYRTSMMQWWADYLDSLRDRTPKPVKPIF